MNIEIENLSVEIDSAKILKALDLSISNKEFVGLIGPNGSGKTTLLKTIYRVIKDYSGTILLDTDNIKNLRIKDSAKKIGVISQHNNYAFDFSVEDIVYMGRSPCKKMFETDNKTDVEIVKAAMKEAGMVGYEKRSFSSLSGGEQQRVILARALAQKTSCLVMDEPTNHLDIKHQYRIMNLVKSLGLTVFTSIHDLNIAAYYSDRIYLINNGEIQISGTPKEVLTRENINEHFGIDAEVFEDKNGKLRILYNP